MNSNSIDTRTWKVRFVRKQIDEPYFDMIVDKDAIETLGTNSGILFADGSYCIDDNSIEDFLCDCFGSSRGTELFQTIDYCFYRFIVSGDKEATIDFDDIAHMAIRERNLFDYLKCHEEVMKKQM